MYEKTLENHVLIINAELFANGMNVNDMQPNEATEFENIQDTIKLKLKIKKCMNLLKLNGVIKRPGFDITD